MSLNVGSGWSRRALITVDVQNDFTLPGAPAEIPGTFEAVAAMGRLADAFRRCAMPIIHVVRLYLPDGSNADLCRKEVIAQGHRVVAPGSDGAEIVDGLKPGPGTRLDADLLLSGRLQELGRCEWAVYKPRWGAFYATPLHEHLQRLGVDTLIVCGCNFPNCPRTTVYEASERDFDAVVVSDAVSGLYERAEEELTNIGVRCFESSRYLAVLVAGMT
jgi:nicotinamidase-related amidase